MAWSAYVAYCEALFELAEDDIDLLRARLADRLGVSRPAVSEMVKRLQAEGLVEVSGGCLKLTAAGLDLAEQGVRRHRLAERLLVDVIGLGWAEAHELAASWQQVIDDRTEGPITELLGAPTTCPHGNPIPGSAYQPGDTVPLREMSVGDVGQVARVTEQLEVEPGVLSTLERAGVVPGNRVSVLSIGPDGAIAVRAAREVIAMSAATAAGILVTPGDLAAISDAVARRGALSS